MSDFHELKETRLSFNVAEVCDGVLCIRLFEFRSDEAPTKGQSPADLASWYTLRAAIAHSGEQVLYFFCSG